MKIIYFISVMGHGRGGHFHSLNHISQKIGEYQDVKIISFGPGKSDVIESNPHFHKHLKFKGFDFFKLRREIKKESRAFDPDIYHCFDTGSYNIVRLIVSSRKNKIVLNKCGGPNPEYFPHVKNLILFSLENQKWFQRQKKFKTSNIHVIPNRVKPLIHNPGYRPIEKAQDDFIFMRICRIGHKYKKSILDAFNLISKLISKNVKSVKLFIVGTIEDMDVLNDLKNNELAKNGHVIFLTESEYTAEASKMLYLADCVIGTGRGLMEAASLGKPVLAIDKNGETPVLLNDVYFEDAFKTNFSERNSFGHLNADENLNNISMLIREKSYYRLISEYVSNCFDLYFNLDKVAQAYPAAYMHSTTSDRQLLADFPFIVRNLFGFYRSYQNSKS